MKFENRLHAGKALAKALKNYPNAIAIGLPRGGVVVAAEVAKAHHIPLDIICPRKIGSPLNPEYALGAVTETGEAILEFPAEVDEIILKEAAEAKRRLSLYRGSRPPRQLKGKTVLLIDDGLATGSTMKAAIATAKSEHAAKIIVAVPVSPPDTLAEIKDLVDETVCLLTPHDFVAVGQFYNHFAPVTDQEVIQYLFIF